jgi:uncharacterized protein YdeI (YjbR/CyaY-like superfamily)
MVHRREFRATIGTDGDDQETWSSPMGTRDPRVDVYIAKAPDFARPILEHLREVVHAACPDVVETIKWSFPNFSRHGILCSMAAFKAHCWFRFWNHAAVFGDGGESGDEPSDTKGRFGRITNLSDLPNRRTLVAYVRKAVKLDDAGVKRAPKRGAGSRMSPPVPDDLRQALRASKKALGAFDRLSPSHRREYIEWIVEAKRSGTRQRRVATTIEWLQEGKTRNWKYDR